MDEFFEALKRRADFYAGGRKDPMDYYKGLGIGATIAALKEMIIGEPIPMEGGDLLSDQIAVILGLDESPSGVLIACRGEDKK